MSADNHNFPVETNAFLELQSKVIIEKGQIRNSEIELSRILRQIFNQRIALFPNDVYRTYEDFLCGDLKITRPWVSDFIKCGYLVEVLIDYNSTVPAEDRLPFPLSIYHLKSLPFDETEDTKKFFIQVWRRAVFLSGPVLPMPKQVKKAKSQIMKLRSRSTENSDVPSEDGKHKRKRSQTPKVHSRKFQSGKKRTEKSKETDEAEETEKAGEQVDPQIHKALWTQYQRFLPVLSTFLHGAKRTKRHVLLNATDESGKFAVVSATLLMVSAIMAELRPSELTVEERKHYRELEAALSNPILLGGPFRKELRD